MMFSEKNLECITDIDRKRMINFLVSSFDRIPDHIPSIPISEYAQQRRVLPSGTPFPGPWDNARTPYLVEPMDNMSILSPIQRTVIMKGAQLGFTAAAENVVVYWIDVCPAEILFISATDQLLRKWVVKRLEPAIDSCGARHKIFAQLASGVTTRRSADKQTSKEFIGGSLDLASAQSAASLRSDSKRVLIRDEIDGAPPQLKTGEGNWLDVSYVRTNAWGERRKVLDFSTPTTVSESAIAQEYELGDKRRFMIPCPFCGVFQTLEWGDESSDHGMKIDTEAGELKMVYYACEACGEPIRNHHKAKMFREGYWEPTSKSESKHLRSYYLSSLYSPLGMLSWEEIWDKYVKSQDDPDGMRSFTNLYLGLPYEELGRKPKIENIVELRGVYRSGTAPNDVLFLTIAVDVQRGSATSRDNPARVELEVCGHSEGFRTYSVDYMRFEGSVADPNEGAWELLAEHWKTGGLEFKKQNGQSLGVQLIFIDSGDGSLTDIVYRFTRGWQNTYPTKGFQALRSTVKKDAGDVVGLHNVRRYKPLKVSDDLLLYEISTNYYKRHIYNNLNIQRDHLADQQKPGFCDFPVDYDETYFRMLTAEEERSDGSFHCPSRRRNEALDCRVMNMCAADVYLDSLMQELRAAAKDTGATKGQIDQIGIRWVLDWLKRSIGNNK